MLLHTHLHYQKDKRAQAGNLQKSNAPPKIGVQSSEKYVHFFIFNWLNDIENFLLWFIDQNYFLTQLTAQEVMRPSEA